jgi:hypothetical protein
MKAQCVVGFRDIVTSTTTAGTVLALGTEYVCLQVLPTSECFLLTHKHGLPSVAAHTRSSSASKAHKRRIRSAINHDPLPVYLLSMR